MDRIKLKKILGFYLGGRLTPELEDAVKGWLYTRQEDLTYESFLGDYFRSQVTRRKPTPGTYRRFRELCIRLGIQRRALVNMPVFRYTLIRIAAVVFPVTVIAGLSQHFLDTYPAASPADKAIVQMIPETVATEDSTEPDVFVPQDVEDLAKADPVKTGESNSHSVRAVAEVERIEYDIDIYAPANEHKYIRLPDNSTVLLNGGSRLAYSSASRKAQLDGEAFFAVEKGKGIPFTVKAGKLDLTVTGTRFNVNTGPGAGSTVVDLISGSVEVCAGQKQMALRPNERITFEHGSGAMTKARVDVSGWWKEPVGFDGRRLSEILEGIEGWYGIPLKGREKITSPVEYSVKFDRMSPVEYVLDAIKVFAPGFEYRYDGSGIKVEMVEADKI